MNVEQFVERKLTGETDVLEKKNVPELFSPPETSNDLNWNRTGVAVV
jgi:hypothetical protein